MSQLLGLCVQSIAIPRFGGFLADLLDWSGVLALGTDFPVEDINPLETFYAAVARKVPGEKSSEAFQILLFSNKNNYGMTRFL